MKNLMSDMGFTRRDFLKAAGIFTLSMMAPKSVKAAEQKAGSGNSKPNIILLMADDLGYGDVGFVGNKIIKTPYLDGMAKNSIKFTRFYAAAPVCSPTRGTCLTGRYNFRYGIFSASVGYLPAEEITIAKMCKSLGYTTGHFGKWHLAPITRTGQTMPEYYEDRERKYAPPWERDYDVSFTTECNVPTWNPLDSKRFDKDSQLGFLQNGVDVTENVEGTAARVVMDRVLPFINKAAKNSQPFMATVWFHEPHDPVVAGPEYKAMYWKYNYDQQHYYGCITAMDEQIGRLRKELQRLGIAENTMLWFCSDNGPAHLAEPGDPAWWMRRSRGVTGGLRARKRSLFEGGVRVPALLEWPKLVKKGRSVDIPCSTMDYFPTIQEHLGFKTPPDWPIDGVNLMPLIESDMKERPKPIPFCSPMPLRAAQGSPPFALIDNNFKLLTTMSKDVNEDLLFDLIKDPAEKNNIIKEQPEVAKKMRKTLKKWYESCRKSHAGGDYDSPFEAINRFPEITDEGIRFRG
jgi:arylsulfatase A-like enzyme